MRIWAARQVIKDFQEFSKNTNLVFAMATILRRREAITPSLDESVKAAFESKPECGTACCIKGFIGITMFRVQESSQLPTEDSKVEQWLDLTQRQSNQLFYPNARYIRRQRNILPEEDVWGELNDPIHIYGREGVAEAILAVERAIEFWGEPGTEVNPDESAAEAA